MASVTCGLTAEDRDQLRNTTLECGITFTNCISMCVKMQRSVLETLKRADIKITLADSVDDAVQLIHCESLSFLFLRSFPLSLCPSVSPSVSVSVSLSLCLSVGLSVISLIDLSNPNSASVSPSSATLHQWTSVLTPRGY